MPIGIILDVCCYAFGSILGAALGTRVPEQVSKAMVLILGYATMALGVSLIVRLHALAPVMLALTFGTLIGELLELEGRTLKGLKAGGEVLAKNTSIHALTDEKYLDMLITVIMIFAFGPTGLLGSLSEGMSGDSSVMLAKAMIDIVASATFAIPMGLFVVAVAVPQLAVYIVMFFLAKLIAPHTDHSMIANFSACGGIIALASGFKICGIQHVRITNTLPAFILVMPITWVWNLVS